jgi:hypothetical protein
MTENHIPRVALLFPGNLEQRQAASVENNRFADIFRALITRGAHAEPAVYHDDFCGEVRKQIERLDAVLVWINPIQDGRDRTVLDAMLRDVAQSGVFVSAHPDVILKMGAKDVLYRTREIGWTGDTRLYNNMQELRRGLPEALATGKARVLKQYRGNGGIGVWKVQIAEGLLSPGSPPRPETLVRIRHAKRGCVEETVTLEDFFAVCEPYFSGAGKMIDQDYQVRLVDGMIRCYLCHGLVVGFGHQSINALYPAPIGAPASEAPQPGPRLYHPPTKPEFQPLKNKLEREWVPAMRRMLDIREEDLPVLWDADFFLGPKDADGLDTYVLCEINVSSVAPYPESAVPFVAEAVIARARESASGRARLG